MLKGDPNYRPYYDDAWDSDSDSVDEERVHDPYRKRQTWLDEHYDILTELYHHFKETGERAFGRPFYQFGDFVQFTNLIYDNTLFTDPNLLNKGHTQQHVGNVGAGTRRQHWLHGIQTANRRGEAGEDGQAARKRWSAAVGTLPP